MELQKDEVRRSGVLKNPGTITNRFGTQVPNTPEQFVNNANQSAMYVVSAQAANPPAPISQMAQRFESQIPVGNFAPPAAVPIAETLIATPSSPEEFAASPIQPGQPSPGFFSQRLDAYSQGRRAEIAAPVQRAVAAQPVAQAAAPAAAPPAAPTPTTPPGNVITRIGNSYQGQNITGDIQLQNGQGVPIDGRGGTITAQNNQAAENLSARYAGANPIQGLAATRGGGTVSSLDTSAGYTQDLKDLAAIQAGKDQVAADNKAQYDALQTQTLTRQYLGGNKAAGAILNRNQQTATTRRGQDQQATQQGAITKLAQQKQGVDIAGQNLDQQGKIALQKAQNAVINAKTPAEKVAAEDVLRTLLGKFEKTKQDNFAYAPGGSIIDPATGQLVPQQGVIFNKATGAVVGQQAAKPLTAPPPDGSKIEDKNGKKYIVKNGVPVPL